MEPLGAPFLGRAVNSSRSLSLQASEPYEDRNVKAWPTPHLYLSGEDKQLIGTLVGGSGDGSCTPRARAQWWPAPGEPCRALHRQLGQVYRRSRSVQASDPYPDLDTCASFRAAVSMRSGSETPRRGVRSASPASSSRTWAPTPCTAGSRAIALGAHSPRPGSAGPSYGRRIGQPPSRSPSPSTSAGIAWPHGRALDTGIAGTPHRQSCRSGPRKPFQAVAEKAQGNGKSTMRPNSPALDSPGRCISLERATELCGQARSFLSTAGRDGRLQEALQGACAKRLEIKQKNDELVRRLEAAGETIDRQLQEGDYLAKQLEASGLSGATSTDLKVTPARSWHQPAVVKAFQPKAEALPLTSVVASPPAKEVGIDEFLQNWASQLN